MRAVKVKGLEGSRQCKAQIEQMILEQYGRKEQHGTSIYTYCKLQIKAQWACNANLHNVALDHVTWTKAQTTTWHYDND